MNKYHQILHKVLAEGKTQTIGNPFARCRKVEFNATMNYNATYTDMMFYTEREAA